jgi:hypothetical protein
MGYSRLVENIIKDIRESDEGVGYEPLIREFVYDVNTLTPEEKTEREIKIKGYYQSIYNRTNNLRQAYNLTKKWATKIFLTPYVKKTLDQVRGQ